MAVLPVLSGQEVVRVFESFGWNVARQRSSHIIMTKAGEV
jgi:predicted RNA binding protein YcfA (HicA-like mRNA interferase family)